MAVLSIPAASAGLDNKFAISALQLDYTTKCCKQGTNIIYFWTKASDQSEADLQACRAKWFSNTLDEEEESGRPLILWAGTYMQNDRTPLEGKLPENLITIRDPGNSVGYEEPFAEAQRVFKLIAGKEAEFLIKRPAHDRGEKPDLLDVLQDVDVAALEQPTSETKADEPPPATTSSAEAPPTTTAEPPSTTADQPLQEKTHQVCDNDNDQAES